MKNDLISVLKKEGKYVLLVKVRKEFDGIVMRNDIIELDKNDILDVDVQNQIDKYMSQHDIRKIILNDNVVWEASKRTVLDMTGQNGRMY